MRIVIDEAGCPEETAIKVNIKKSHLGKMGLVCIAVIFLLFFWAGYQCAARIDLKKKSEQIQTMKNHIKERDDGWEQMPQLGEEDEKFLMNHLYGIWKFEQRIVALKEIGCAGDFSEQGVEEMAEVYIVYEDDFVDRKGYNKDTFSEVKDIFLFAEYGGNSTVGKLVYHIDKQVDGKSIQLRHILGGEQELPVSLPENKKLVHVYFDLGYDTSLCPAVDTNFFGSNIYINPDDTDTIYMDFGGLWELKRVGERGSYSTAGKNEK